MNPGEEKAECRAVAAERRRGADSLRTRWKERNPESADSLGDALDALYESADMSVIAPDPLELVLRYADHDDQEVAGFITAAWAYGRADQIVKNAGKALDVMGGSPADFVDSVAAGNWTDLDLFEQLVHRFHRGGDWASLCWFTGDTRARYGSLGRAFTDWWSDAGGDIRRTLMALRNSYNDGSYPGKLIRAGINLPTGDQNHLIPDASKGSPCKRFNLWLRWMIRKDHIDPGPWRTLAPDGPGPADLIIPLDTHMARLGRILGLTDYRSPGWRMAEDITAFLAYFDPEDPVKYDFALCRLGILELCPKRRNNSQCTFCPVQKWCEL